MGRNSRATVKTRRRPQGSKNPFLRLQQAEMRAYRSAVDSYVPEWQR